MPIDTHRVWRAARPALAGAGRLIAGAALAYAFILVLFTASLQTSISERLAALQPSQDFSTGYSLWEESMRNARTLAELRERERALQAVIDGAERKEGEALSEWRSAMEPMFALQRSLGSVEGCTVRLQGTEQEISADTYLADLRSCVDSENLGASRRQAALEILAQAASIRQLERTTMNAMSDRQRAYRDWEQVQFAIGNRPKADPARTEASRVFRELDSFSRGQLPGSGIGKFPPAMVQILLAFVSGMFGALLVTLVLVVYPKSDLTLSAGAGFAARIFLGGLISRCVFVVLGGGTAVLGTSGGFGDGEANFLAFCAIGILAGMFSDRVAQWLSGRADAFFSRDRAHAG